MLDFTSREAGVLSDVIYAAYDNLPSPETWSEVFRRIGEIIPAEVGGILVYSSPTQAPRMCFSYGISQDIYRPYEDYYYARDIVARAAMAKGILTGRPVDIVDPAEWRNSEILNDFLIPNGVCDVLSTAIVSGPGAGTTLHLLRTDRAEFAPKHVRILSYLQPHLTRAYAQSAASQELTKLNNALIAGYEQVPRPVLLFDEDGRLTFMNSEARQLCESPRDSLNSLYRMVAEEASRIYRAGRIPSAPLMQTQEIVYVRNGQEYSMSTFPVYPPDGPRYCLVVGMETQDHLRALINRSAQLHGLSPRETEVCTSIARGLSNREIADALFISEFTVKDHLKSILAKLGVTSRSKAVAKLLSP